MHYHTLYLSFFLIIIANTQVNDYDYEKHLFIDYLSKYKIVYDSHEELENNLQLFLQQHNNPDFNIEDFLGIKNKKETHFFSNYKKKSSRRLASDDSELLPDFFSWNDTGALNDIQDQGKCGACVVFSVVSIMETYYYIKFREKIKFSEQGVIDCFIVDGDICENGGRIYYIYDFLKHYYPMLEEDYPYISINETSITQFCKYNLSKTVNITEPVLYYLNPNEKTGYVDAYTLAYYVYYYGPVVTRVNADCDNFAFHFRYPKYVISEDTYCNSTDLNHAVVIVGWGFSSTGKLYWVVRNSWGEIWGDNGYAYILGGVNSFGIETFPEFVADDLNLNKDKEIENESKTENDCTCKELYLFQNYLSYIFILFILLSSIN